MGPHTVNLLLILSGWTAAGFSYAAMRMWRRTAYRWKETSENWSAIARGRMDEIQSDLEDAKIIGRIGPGGRVN